MEIATQKSGLETDCFYEHKNRKYFAYTRRKNSSSAEANPATLDADHTNRLGP